jgi:cell division protein FtsB
MATLQVGKIEFDQLISDFGSFSCANVIANLVNEIKEYNDKLNKLKQRVVKLEHFVKNSSTCC